MKENKEFNVCVRINSEESKMLSIIKNKHCMNISKLIRKFIRDTYEGFERNEKKIFR